MQQNRTEGFQRLRETDLITRNFVQLNTYISDPEVRYFEDSSVYPLEQFFSQVGGTMNLWIGITFVTLVEIVDLFLCVCFGEVTKRDSRTLTDRNDEKSPTKSSRGPVVPISAATIHGGSPEGNRYEPSPRSGMYCVNDTNNENAVKLNDHNKKHTTDSLAATPYAEPVRKSPKHMQPPGDSKNVSKSNGAMSGTLSVPSPYRREPHQQRVRSPRKKTTVVRNGDTVHI